MRLNTVTAGLGGIDRVSYLTGKLDRLNEILYIILNNLDCIKLIHLNDIIL